MPPLNSGCCPNYYCRPLVFLQPFSSLSLFIHSLDLPKGALIPLRDPMSSATNILEMGKSKLHGVMGDRGGAKGDRCVLAPASPRSPSPPAAFSNGRWTGDIHHQHSSSFSSSKPGRKKPLNPSQCAGKPRLRGEMYPVQGHKTSHMALKSPDSQPNSFLTVLFFHV